MRLDEIFTFENLYEAYKKCRLSKQHKGEVIRFEMNLSYNITTLIKQLCSKKYEIGKYKKFYIYEPKERLIEALPFKDRIVVRCFCDNVLKDKIEPKLIFDNAACRKNKGTIFALNRLKYFLRKEYYKEKDNNIYFLKVDIKKYFPSINHNVLIKMLSKEGFSDDEMWIMKKMILEQPNAASKGLPLGNQTSQWFALLYLNPIDRLIKETLHIKSYVRYMDDMILIHRDKNYLKKCLSLIEEKCNKELKIELNSKTQIGTAKNGIDFLGYRHILNENGRIIVKLRASSKIRMKRHLKTINKLVKSKKVDTSYLYVRKNAFYNHIKDTDENVKFKMLMSPFDDKFV